MVVLTLSVVRQGIRPQSGCQGGGDRCRSSGGSGNCCGCGESRDFAKETGILLFLL